MITGQPLACLYGGRDVGVQLHHPTGREWDPDIVVPLCHDHHRLVEDDWHPAGVAAKIRPETTLHQLRAGLLRWAMLVGRLAEHHLPVLLVPLARWLAATAMRIDRVISALDVGLNDQWRVLPGIGIESTSPLEKRRDVGCGDG